MQKPLLWVTDPWQTLDHSRDATLRLAEEAWILGYPQYWCDVRSIRLENGVIQLDGQKIHSVEPKRTSDSFTLKAPQVFQPDHFRSIQYRPDPPVDRSYIYPLQLLQLGIQNSRSTEIVNPASVLPTSSEKIEGGRWTAPSIVSSQWESLSHFGKKTGKTVLKPLNQAQSQGIELLDWTSRDGVEFARERLLDLTRHFTVPVILQLFLEGIAEGEIRLWYLNGKLLAYVKKLPITGDFRVDMDRGSPVTVARLNRREKTVADQIGKHLKFRKIRLAAVDLIEGWITDFNFTSPGLITQMESVLNENLARPIVKALAGKRILRDG